MRRNLSFFRNRSGSPYKGIDPPGWNTPDGGSPTYGDREAEVLLFQRNSDEERQNDDSFEQFSWQTSTGDAQAAKEEERSRGRPPSEVSTSTAADEPTIPYVDIQDNLKKVTDANAAGGKWRNSRLSGIAKYLGRREQSGMDQRDDSNSEDGMDRGERAEEMMMAISSTSSEQIQRRESLAIREKIVVATSPTRGEAKLFSQLQKSVDVVQKDQQRRRERSVSPTRSPTRSPVNSPRKVRSSPTTSKLSPSRRQQIFFAYSDEDNGQSSSNENDGDKREDKVPRKKSNGIPKNVTIPTTPTPSQIESIQNGETVRVSSPTKDKDSSKQQSAPADAKQRNAQPSPKRKRLKDGRTNNSAAEKTSPKNLKKPRSPNNRDSLSEQDLFAKEAALLAKLIETKDRDQDEDELFKLSMPNEKAKSNHHRSKARERSEAAKKPAEKSYQKQESLLSDLMQSDEEPAGEIVFSDSRKSSDISSDDKPHYEMVRPRTNESNQKQGKTQTPRSPRRTEAIGTKGSFPPKEIKCVDIVPGQAGQKPSVVVASRHRSQPENRKVVASLRQNKSAEWKSKSHTTAPEASPKRTSTAKMMDKKRTRSKSPTKATEKTRKEQSSKPKPSSETKSPRKQDKPKNDGKKPKQSSANENSPKLDSQSSSSPSLDRLLDDPTSDEDDFFNTPVPTAAPTTKVASNPKLGETEGLLGPLHRGSEEDDIIDITEFRSDPTQTQSEKDPEESFLRSLDTPFSEEQENVPIRELAIHSNNAYQIPYSLSPPSSPSPRPLQEETIRSPSTRGGDKNGNGQVRQKVLRQSLSINLNNIVEQYTTDQQLTPTTAGEEGRGVLSPVSKAETQMHSNNARQPSSRTTRNKGEPQDETIQESRAEIQQHNRSRNSAERVHNKERTRGRTTATVEKPKTKVESPRHKETNNITKRLAKEHQTSQTKPSKETKAESQRQGNARHQTVPPKKSHQSKMVTSPLSPKRSRSPQLRELGPIAEYDSTTFSGTSANQSSKQSLPKDNRNRQSKVPLVPAPPARATHLQRTEVKAAYTKSPEAEPARHYFTEGSTSEPSMSVEGWGAFGSSTFETAESSDLNDPSIIIENQKKTQGALGWSSIAEVVTRGFSAVRDMRDEFGFMFCQQQDIDGLDGISHQCNTEELPTDTEFENETTSQPASKKSVLSESASEFDLDAHLRNGRQNRANAKKGGEKPDIVLTEEESTEDETPEPNKEAKAAGPQNLVVKIDPQDEANSPEKNPTTKETSLQRPSWLARFSPRKRKDKQNDAIEEAPPSPRRRIFQSTLERLSPRKKDAANTFTEHKEEASTPSKETENQGIANVGPHSAGEGASSANTNSQRNGRPFNLFQRYRAERMKRQTNAAPTPSPAEVEEEARTRVSSATRGALSDEPRSNPSTTGSHSTVKRSHLSPANTPLSPRSPVSLSGKVVYLSPGSPTSPYSGGGVGSSMWSGGAIGHVSPESHSRWIGHLSPGSQTRWSERFAFERASSIPTRSSIPTSIDRSFRSRSTGTGTAVTGLTTHLERRDDAHCVRTNQDKTKKDKDTLCVISSGDNLMVPMLEIERRRSDPGIAHNELETTDRSRTATADFTSGASTISGTEGTSFGMTTASFHTRDTSIISLEDGACRTNRAVKQVATELKDDLKDICCSPVSNKATINMI